MPKSKTKQAQQAHQAHPKRLTVTDPSGWTHVTTTTRAQRIPQSPSPSPSHPELHPAEPPRDLTLADLQTRFARHHERWLASRSWALVRDALLPAAAAAATAEAGPVADLVAISLGSFSGFLRGGWVDRRAVSMDQLAALVSIRDLLKTPAYTQDPVYNTLDKALLAALDIAVVNDPDAFDLVSESSFAYCPGAERAHLEAVLARMPRGLFGGPVEDMVGDNSHVARRFLALRSSSRLPGYDPDEKAFYGMRLYLS